ncbi:MAG: alpha-1,2-fucosyltransferase, partial [Lachnospiraceae bacterium]|nr:alpha-1,2-fucosyltransferase [Lachnospiraceae bacterium]
WKYSFYEEKEQHYDQRSLDIRDDSYIKGWFQSERYFSDIREVIEKEIILKEKIRSPRDILDIIDRSDSVAIHVRRGDYVRINMAMPAGYYRKASQVVKEKVKHPRYVVFSDNIDWAKRNLRLNEECFYIGRELGLNENEELMLMSRCSSIIISNSTFSWWGAWLNKNKDKTVIAPREDQWFKGQKGILPEKWTAI